jgi:regulator of sirC expression with transglutaminase-like and TPR domain
LILAYYYRGLAYKDAGKKSLAITDLEKFISLTTDSQWIAKAKAIIDALNKLPG